METPPEAEAAFRLHSEFAIRSKKDAGRFVRQLFGDQVKCGVEMWRSCITIFGARLAFTQVTAYTLAESP